MVEALETPERNVIRYRRRFRLRLVPFGSPVSQLATRVRTIVRHSLQSGGVYNNHATPPGRTSSPERTSPLLPLLQEFAGFPQLFPQ